MFDRNALLEGRNARFIKTKDPGAPSSSIPFWISAIVPTGIAAALGWPVLLDLATSRYDNMGGVAAFCCMAAGLAAALLYALSSSGCGGAGRGLVTPLVALGVAAVAFALIGLLSGGVVYLGQILPSVLVVVGTVCAIGYLLFKIVKP